MTARQGNVASGLSFSRKATPHLQTTTYRQSKETYAMSGEENKEKELTFVKLVSAEGSEFYIDRSVAISDENLESRIK